MGDVFSEEVDADGGLNQQRVTLSFYQNLLLTKRSMMLVLPVALSPRRTILQVLFPKVDEVIDINSIYLNIAGTVLSRGTECNQQKGIYEGYMVMVYLRRSKLNSKIGSFCIINGKPELISQLLQGKHRKVFGSSSQKQQILHLTLPTYSIRKNTSPYHRVVPVQNNQSNAGS